jgi:hypothetical protein
MPNRVVIGSIVVAALAVLAAMKSYDLSTQQVSDPYGVTAGQTRFAAALELLPASGVIGYLSDMPLDDNVGSIAYMAAQYAVAPRAIVPVEKAQAEWALGNFAHPGNFAERGAQAGYRIVNDFSNGVVVYRRSNP